MAKSMKNGLDIAAIQRIKDALTTVAPDFPGSYFI